MFQLVEEALYQVSLLVLYTIIGDRLLPVFLRRDYRLNAMEQQFFPDRVGVISLIRQHRFDLIANQPQKRQKAAVVVDFAASKPESYRPTLSVAPGVDFGGETTARTAKGRLVLIPPFKPAAHWCARITVLSII